ncbi:MAG: hypothetical protein WB609_00100 [Candidatus Cybelea sp.]
MLLPRIFRLGVVAAVLTAAVMLTSAQQASAAHETYVASIRNDSGAPKGFNHIICYNVAPASKFAGATVALFDQFFPNGFQTKLAQTKIACTPAKKVLLYRKPIKVTPNRHFVCYPINDPPTIQTRKNYVNQLEKNSTTFVTPVALCVPTLKYGAPALPPHPNHLLVYDQLLQGASFVNPLQPTTVTLFDQFFPSGFTVTLGNPFALLTPTEKKLIHQKAIPVTPNGHWVEYSFTSPTKVSTTRDYTNQLETNTVNVFFPSFLLVPTNKS